MINHHHAELMMHALRAATHIKGNAAQVEHGRIKLRALETQLDHNHRTLETVVEHEEKMFALKADLVRDFIRALIEQRIDVVYKGFVKTLDLYAEQCRHYLSQQNSCFEASQTVTDTIQNAKLERRTRDIDIKLSNIRLEAAALDREMNKTILLIGGTMPTISPENQRALAI